MIAVYEPTFFLAVTLLPRFGSVLAIWAWNLHDERPEIMSHKIWHILCWFIHFWFPSVYFVVSSGFSRKHVSNHPVYGHYLCVVSVNFLRAFSISVIFIKQTLTWKLAAYLRHKLIHRPWQIGNLTLHFAENQVVSKTKSNSVAQNSRMETAGMAISKLTLRKFTTAFNQESTAQISDVNWPKLNIHEKTNSRNREQMRIDSQPKRRKAKET